MNPNTEEKPVYYTTPDGVERLVRYHLGAEKRIAEHFKMPVGAVFSQFDKASYPAILWCLMHGPGGVPPADLNLIGFEESVYPEHAPEMMAAILSAFSKGVRSKNEIEALIKAGLQSQAIDLTGFRFGPSPVSASDLPTTNSGGSVNGNSTPSVIDIKNSENLTTSAQA